MEEIKLYIISNENNNDENNSKSVSNIESEEEELKSNENIEEKYKIWLKDLIILMNSCSYRKVLGQIEKEKDIYKSLDLKELWKYKMIQLKAIFRIIKRKLEKYKTEIKRENTHQNKSIKFWYDKAFNIFEELINDYSYENNKIDDKYYINIIQNIIQKYFEFFYLIILFHRETNEVAKICIYLSFVDIFLPFMNYVTDFNSIFLLQKLLLFRAKISLQNKNYLQTIEYQKHVMRLSFRILLFIANIYALEEYDDSNSNNRHSKKNVYQIFVNLLLAFYLRGITCEQLGDINRAAKSYIFCKWIYLKFLLDDNELFGMFISKIESNSISRVKIIHDIRNIVEKRKIIKKRKNKKITLKLLVNKNINLNVKNPSKKYKIINNGFNKNVNSEELEDYLEKIGEKMYKEEENRNNNLIKKFTKSRYIISTLTMMDHLLSKDFKNILLKMNKIEITKPKDDIKALINKTIIQKRRRLFNSNLEKSRRAISAMNINNRELYEKNNNSLKSSMIKNEINNNIKKKFKILRENNKANFSISTSITFNPKEKSSTNNYKKSTNQTSFKMPNYTNKTNDNLNQNIKIQKNISIKKINIFHNNKTNLTKNYTSTYKLQKNNSQEVIKYHFDKYEFSKCNLKKKNYIDKYYDKELDFHKKLLNSKKYEIKKTSEIESFDRKKVRYSAEREYDIIFNVEKIKYNQKEMSNLLNIKELKKINDLNEKEIKKEQDNDLTSFKMEKTMIDGRKKRQRRLGIIELNQKKLIWQNNEGKMKKLNAECDEISFRQKQLKNQRRDILLKMSEGK